MNPTPGSENASAQQEKAHVDWFCDWLRQGAEHTAGMFAPPENAGKHFREARIEFLKGMRELLDFRIDRLSRNAGNRGTRVTVD